MDIEIIHNTLVLPIRRTYKLVNSKLAEERFDRWISAKHPDYRVRYIFDHATKTLELGGRNEDSVIIAENALRFLDITHKRIPFIKNSKLKDIRDKLYKGI